PRCSTLPRQGYASLGHARGARPAATSWDHGTKKPSYSKRSDMSLQCPICMERLVALDRELAKYQDSATIPINDVVTVLNQVSNGRLRIVALPKEAHLEALELAKQKMKERKVKITADVADGLLQIPKSRYEEWWENDP